MTDAWMRIPRCERCGAQARYTHLGNGECCSYYEPRFACDECFALIVRVEVEAREERRREEHRRVLAAPRERLNRIKAHRREFGQCVDCGGVPELNREQCARCRMIIEEGTLYRNPQ